MVHNSYLGLSLQIGILGATAFFAPLLLVAIKGIQLSMRVKDPMMTMFVGPLIAGLVISLTESWLYSAGNSQSLPFWILFGILVRLVLKTQRMPVEVFPRGQPAYSGSRGNVSNRVSKFAPGWMNR